MKSDEMNIGTKEYGALYYETIKLLENGLNPDEYKLKLDEVVGNLTVPMTIDPVGWRGYITPNVIGKVAVYITASAMSPQTLRQVDMQILKEGYYSGVLVMYWAEKCLKFIDLWSGESEWVMPGDTLFSDYFGWKVDTTKVFRYEGSLLEVYNSLFGESNNFPLLYDYIKSKELTSFWESLRNEVHPPEYELIKQNLKRIAGRDSVSVLENSHLTISGLNIIPSLVLKGAFKFITVIEIVEDLNREEMDALIRKHRSIHSALGVYKILFINCYKQQVVEYDSIQPQVRVYEGVNHIQYIEGADLLVYDIFEGIEKRSLMVTSDMPPVI